MNEKKSYRYEVVDVFTQTPLEGNPLAVFTDAASSMLRRCNGSPAS